MRVGGVVGIVAAVVVVVVVGPIITIIVVIDIIVIILIIIIISVVVVIIVVRLFHLPLVYIRTICLCTYWHRVTFVRTTCFSYTTLSRNMRTILLNSFWQLMIIFRDTVLVVVQRKGKNESRETSPPYSRAHT